MQTSPAPQNKKTGRKPKYNSDDEREQAKREQTRRSLQKMIRKEKKQRTKEKKNIKLIY